MSAMNLSLPVCAFAGAALMLAGCARTTEPPRKQVSTDVVATVGSSSVTLAEGDRTALQVPAASFGNMKLSQALYESRRGGRAACVAHPHPHHGAKKAWLAVGA